MRDFRLMMSVTLQGDPSNVARREEIVSLRDGMSTTLRSASLPNRVCDAADLINWCSLFLNPDRITSTHAPDLHYDDGREIRDQIVDHDTIQDARANGLHLWKEGARRRPGRALLLHQVVPRALRPVADGVAHRRPDAAGAAVQRSPFLLTMGVHILDPNATRTTVTANHVRATQNAGSKMAVVMPDVGKKARDWSAAADAIDTGGALVSMYHQLGLFCHPPRSLRRRKQPRPSGARGASS
jgi:conjugal transfer ATP-binding protein TraC